MLSTYEPAPTIHLCLIATHFYEFLAFLQTCCGNYQQCC